MWELRVVKEWGRVMGENGANVIEQNKFCSLKKTSIYHLTVSVFRSLGTAKLTLCLKTSPGHHSGIGWDEVSSEAPLETGPLPHSLRLFEKFIAMQL